MMLNRNNYEEFFILYVDNELGSEDRRAVELFTKENPDLKEELDLLLSSKLTPDTSIVFDKKEILMSGISSPIDLSNYESKFLSYIDNELPEAERREVENFVSVHPSLKGELDWLQRSKLQPESIVFPDKNSLYRKEEKARVIGITWRRLSVAAVLLVAISTTAIIIVNSNRNGDVVGPVASTIDNQGKKNEKAATEPANIETKLAEVSQLPSSVDAPAITAKKMVTDQKKEPAVRYQPLQPLTDKSTTIASQGNVIKKRGNDLPQPVNNPNIIRNEDTKNTTAQIDVPKKPLTIPEEFRGSTVVTDDVVATSNNISPADEEGIEQPAEKKNKLRGFFRKITRTIEKRTNIKATDDDDRLLIAGLSIKLK
ncbi:MAG: hypothetical protein H7Y42_18670 [Chitinophagaceae bacterium]|nr:hypothetical protein [Chitinophagaceae bacterium]